MNRNDPPLARSHGVAVSVCLSVCLFVVVYLCRSQGLQFRRSLHEGLRRRVRCRHSRSVTRLAVCVNLRGSWYHVVGLAWMPPV